MDKTEVIEALQTIQDYCRTIDDCRWCCLFKAQGCGHAGCVLMERKFPAGWMIGDWIK